MLPLSQVYCSPTNTIPPRPVHLVGHQINNQGSTNAAQQCMQYIIRCHSDNKLANEQAIVASFTWFSTCLHFLFNLLLVFSSCLQMISQIVTNFTQSDSTIKCNKTDIMWEDIQWILSKPSFLFWSFLNGQHPCM